MQFCESEKLATLFLETLHVGGATGFPGKWFTMVARTVDDSSDI